MTNWSSVWRFLAAAADEGEGRFEDSVLDERLGNKLFAPGVDGGPAGYPEALAQSRVEEADALEAFGAGHPEVGYLALVDAGAAEALHAEEDAFQAAGLMGERPADERTAEVVDDGGYFLGELPGQRFDGPFRHAAFLRGPFRRLGDAVFLAQDVVLDLVHAHGVGLDIFLVPGAFL